MPVAGKGEILLIRKLFPRARKVKDIAGLRRFRDALFTAESNQEVKRILPRR